MTHSVQRRGSLKQDGPEIKTGISTTQFTSVAWFTAKVQTGLRSRMCPGVPLLPGHDQDGQLDYSSPLWDWPR